MVLSYSSIPSSCVVFHGVGESGNRDLVFEPHLEA